MRKLYSIFTFMMCVAALSFNAKAQTSTEDIDVTFCINIEDPSLCYVQNSYGERIDLNAGENVFTTVYHQTTYSDGSQYGYSDSFSIYLESDKTADYTINAVDIVYAGSTEKTPFPGFSGPRNYAYLDITPDMEGSIIYPVIANLAEMRTAVATVIVDYASNVKISCGYNGYTPELTDGTNTIKFNPETEASWTIGPKEYGTYLGGVTVNGVAQNERYGNYYIEVANDDVVDITAATSNEPVSVRFKIMNEGTKDAIAGVYIYKDYQREPVADWQNGFEVAPRTDIIVDLDMNAYKFTSFTVNGEQQQLWSNELYITISADTYIVYEATKYGTFDVELTINDPEAVKISVAESMYSGSTPLTDIVAGTQTLKISEINAYMIVDKVDGYIIDTIAYIPAGSTEEIEVEESYSGYYVPLTGTASVIIKTHAVVRDQKATLWINDIDKCYMLYLQRADGSDCFNTYGSVAPVTGDQTFDFNAEVDNPMTLYFSPTDYENPGYVMINDEIIAPKYEGSTSYEFNVSNGDVIKVYLCTDPLSGILDITAPAATTTIYNIMGVKVTNTESLTPGIYVINGKKVIVK